jgi:MtrB/PioB family decaheme-associated outer membrane protein
MKTNKEFLAVNALALAVQAALFSMFAMPAIAFAGDPAIEALTQPDNSIEIGVGNTSKDSAKFGQYNGLNQSGANLIGNFNVFGGNAYKEETGLNRWEIKGTDLGTTSREINGSVSNQGQWSIGFGYDELKHNLSDTYQTPYVGSMGGNSFTLPTGFGTTSDTRTNLSIPQQLFFHEVEVGTTRKNTSISAGYIFNPSWDIKFDFNHLDQTGAKLMALASAERNSALGEYVLVLPNPTNYQTDTVNLALNWAGNKSHLTASYFGSFFRDGYDSLKFSPYAGSNNMQSMSTAPGNDFHQFNLSGGYEISPKTKLVGGFSYARNTQNDAFVVDPFMMNTTQPKTSLNGLVNTTHADLKLIDQTIKNLTLSAGFKYDIRDNKTESNIYNAYAVDGSNKTNYPNTPLSNKKNQFELAGDYRIDKDQKIRLAYNREDVSRWCNQYAINTGYPAGTNCVVATDSKDDKVSATYKIKASDKVDLNATYSYSDRKTNSDTNAIAAFSRASKINALVTGQNANDWFGFYPYFDASRTQQMIKAGVSWQANENLSLSLGGRYTDDSYGSLYGVQNGNSWSINLDSTYSYNETASVSAYISQQHKQRDLKDFNSVATGSWTNKLNDDDTSIGISTKKNGLLEGKLELIGDLSYSKGTSRYETLLNYVAATCSTLGTCGALPDIKSESINFKISGIYKLDKTSKILVGYQFQKLNSSDYYYNALQYGTTSSKMLPTNQQEPNYIENLITISYIYNFK